MLIPLGSFIGIFKSIGWILQSELLLTKSKIVSIAELSFVFNVRPLQGRN
jgi:hypothetical protein